MLAERVVFNTGDVVGASRSYLSVFCLSNFAATRKASEKLIKSRKLILILVFSGVALPFRSRKIR